MNHSPVAFKKLYPVDIRKLSFLALFLFVILPALSQPLLVSGKVQDSAGKAISSATISVKNTEEKIVLFSFSDNSGNFKFDLADTFRNRNIFLEVNALGYTKQKQKIEFSKKEYLFVLELNYTPLENITVSATQKIKSKGDTISYNVQSFATAEDRSIADVIKRLPGMTVADDGTISFNGKRINNLLIHSDDLMDGRYGLATQSISKDMINKVEIIQHYQPISILQDKVYSDDIVVNLTLKDENAIKLSGQAQAALGLPHLINSAADLIVLNKKIKMLNSIKYNNSGKDYRFDFKDLRLTESSYPKDLLSDAVIDNPGIPDKYIYQNNSFSASVNHLYNTKDSVQLRTNIRSFFDKNELGYTSYAENYISNDTIVYKETQKIRRAPYNFDVSLSIVQNKRAYYLKNQVQFNLSGYNNNSYLDFNANPFSQNISTKVKNISNTLQWIPDLFKRDVVNFSWLVSYFNAPQNLTIGTGIDSVLLNNSIEYNSVRQFAQIPALFNKLSINYYVNNHKSVQQSYQIGAENQWQKLNSTIYLTQLDGSVSNYSGDYGNNLTGRQNKYFANANYFIRNEYWSMNLAFPLLLQQIHYRQDEYALNATSNHLFLNPELKGEYFFNGEKSISASYRRHTNFGSIESLYNGIVVTNFRQITNNEAFIREIKSNEINLQYKMNLTIKMLFFNAGVQYKNSLLNSISSTYYTDNVQRTILIPLENTQSRIACFAGISKYFFPIKSKLGIDVSLSRQNSSEYINGQSLPFQGTILNAGFYADCKFIEFATLNYAGAANWMTSKQQNVHNNASGINSEVTIYTHNISLTVTPPSVPLFITIQSKYQLNKNSTFSKTDYFFSDINVRYNSKKLRTNFEFEVNNLFNVQSYSTYYTTPNQLIAASYGLRGRMLMLKGTFNF